SRRGFLQASGTAVVAAAASPHLGSGTAVGQTAIRGGTLTLRLWDSLHFDQYLQASYKTHIVYSFTHTRLLQHKAGPSIPPGTSPIEGDLVGRFHTVKGNANASMLEAVDKVEALDRYTVRFTLRETYAWLLDILASPMVVVIVAAECVEKFGDLRNAEATVGTRPWMFDSYRPIQDLTLVCKPNSLVPGRPPTDRSGVCGDEDNASRMSAFLAGKYDLGWENPGTINRTDWVQIKDALKQRRPNPQTAEFPANVVSGI